MRKSIKGLLVAAVAVVGLVVAPTAQAYDPAEYTGNGNPQFNVYTSVENFGNEKDFFRVGPVKGRGSQFSNSFDACSGEVQLNVYVHNGAPEGFNGENFNGTGVAKDTKVRVNLPTGTGKNFNSTAVISASNAASVSDGATIKCADKEVTMEYVPGSASIYTQPGGSRRLSDEIVKGGALIGAEEDNGIMPGCWEYRAYVSLVVKLKEVEKPEEPKEEKPRELPKTGAGSIVSVFAGTSFVGAAAHRLYVSRRRR